MRLQTKRNRLSRHHRRTRNTKNGSKEDTRSSGLVPANNRHRSTPVPRIHRVLSVLYPKLLENRPTTPRPYKEDNPMALGQTPSRSIQDPKNSHVPKTCVTPTQLCKTLLPSNRRLHVWRGRHTLASGRA